MNTICQIVPWYNIEEWYKVYNNIYATSATLSTKQYALDYLLIWKARCPFLPAGIESTLTLLEVHIQDQNKCYEKWNDHLLRLAYSSALMRFVNHMLDKEIATGLSLYQAAKSTGIPEWIIDLRHDVAHNNKLPSLDLLREASYISFQWLEENYWNKHKLYIHNYSVKNIEYGTETENKITALMQFCISLSICSHPKCGIKNVAEIPDVNLQECLVNDAKELLESSLDLSNLKTVTIANLRFAMNNKAMKLLSNNSVSGYVNKALLSNDSLFLSLELYKLLDNIGYYKNKALNRAYVQCFDGLLHFLFDYDLLQHFILELIKITQNEDENDKKKCIHAARWVSVILKALRKNQQFMEIINKTGKNIDLSKDKKELKALYYHWYPNDKKRTLLLLNLHKPVPRDLTSMIYIQPIISTYNSYLTYFISDLLELVRPQLPQQVITKICDLAKVIASPEKFPAMTSKIYTADELDDLHETMDKDEENIENPTPISDNHRQLIKQKFGIWQVADKTDAWSKCPIGQIPWKQQESSESMDI